MSMVKPTITSKERCGSEKFSRDCRHATAPLPLYDPCIARSKNCMSQGAEKWGSFSMHMSPAIRAVQMLSFRSRYGLWNSIIWSYLKGKPIEGLQQMRPLNNLDGPAIRNANRGRFAWIDSRELIRRATPVFITCKRFARIASNLRFANSWPPTARFAKKKGFSWTGTLTRFARIRRFARIFARIGPSKLNKNLLTKRGE